MEELVCPSTLTSIEDGQQRGYIGYITINSKVTIGAGYCYGSSIKGSGACTFKILYSDDICPLTTSSNIQGYNKNHYYYVPDDLVDAYKATSPYSSFPTRVLP